MATIDEAVRNVLRVKFRLGLFDNPFADENRERATILTTKKKIRTPIRRQTNLSYY